jgi:hemerythrin-like metal-binding protein
MSDLTLCDQHLKTGIGIIDDDHRKLVDLLNRLVAAQREGKSNIILAFLLDDLAKNTVRHFNNEEFLMRQHGYAGTVPHIAEHNILMDELLAFKAQLESGKATVSADLLTFLHDWLYTHILDSDMKLAAALSARGVK